MVKQDLGTIGGKPITQEMLYNYEAAFEKDWLDSEVNVLSTERGRALRALNDLNIPLHEVEALERKANYNHQPLLIYIRSIIKHDLFVSTD